MFCIECLSEVVYGANCSVCGASQHETNRDRRSLRVGHMVTGKYRIGRVLGSGGFGITYIALDLTLKRRVALKEFVPNGLVSRDSDGRSIVCHSEAEHAPFLRGLDRFLKEGQFLAKFDHPNIVKILDVLQANGTAYLAMEYLEGQTLKAALAEKGKFTEHEALDVMTFVFDALRTTHQHGVVHRDIKPDNIYLTNQGRMMLLDFGGAKQLTVEGDRSMDAMFAHGYAAPEQYAGNSEKVGAWTDVYACAATIYKLITSKTPPSALDRYTNDLPLDWSDTCASDRLKGAVAKAMTLSHATRFSSIADFQAAILAGVAVEEPHFGVKPNPSLKLRLIVGVASIVAISALGLKWKFDSESAMRQRVKGAVALEGLRDRLSQYWLVNGRFPVDFTELGGDRISSDSELRKVDIAAGELTVELALPGLEGRRLQLRPTGIEQGRVTFECWSLDLPEKYVPKDVCRIKYH